MNRTAAVATAASLGLILGAGGWHAFTMDRPPEKEPAATTQNPASPAPKLGPPLVAGDYAFDVVGGQDMPVRLDPCGPDCLKLVAGSNASKRVQMRSSRSR